MKDLLGNEITEAQALRLMANKTPQRRGYAAPPGTGPKGETCRTCKHDRLSGNAKSFHKCALRQADWTHGFATDILARAPSCRLWEAAGE